MASRELSVNQVLDIAIAYSTSMSNQMYDNYTTIKDLDFIHPLVLELKYFPDINAYGFNGDELNYDLPLTANLTGIGTKNTITKEMKTVMTAALTLNLSTAVNDKNHHFTWAYFTSAQGFILLAPSVPIDGFHFEEHMYEKPFWQIAIPENNPERALVISDLYNDAGGQGDMVSVSNPIYSKDIFLGVISLDIGIDHLQKSISLNSYSAGGTLALMTSEGKCIVSQKDTQHCFDMNTISPSTIKPYTLSENNDAYFYLSNKIKNKFFLIANISRGEFYALLLKEIFFPSVAFGLVLMVVFLITRLIKIFNFTKNLANVDSLSGLYNRRSFLDIAQSQFNTCVRHEQPLSMLMIDIDFFKNINDMYGHDVGDKSIVSLAKILRETIRKSDIVGRYGGEEFLLFLPNTTTKGAVVLSEKIRKKIEQSDIGVDVSITVSIGCAEYVEDSAIVNIQNLIKKADEMLYVAKENGRNRTVAFLHGENTFEVYC